MKIKIVYEFDKKTRLAIAAHYGEKTPASYNTIKSWMGACIDATLDSIQYDYAKEQRERLAPD